MTKKRYTPELPKGSKWLKWNSTTAMAAKALRISIAGIRPGELIAERA
jgi:hypothetical protein